eukprot:scaffold3375_cov153-Cylindrotheca_fusiformis.AAC.3
MLARPLCPALQHKYSEQLLQTVIQSHNTVVDVVLVGSCRNELKELTKVEGIIASDLDGSSDKNDERRRGCRWLHVH